MTIANLIRFALLISTMLIVFGFGLSSTVRDATSLLRKPALLVRSLLAMNVLMPFFAALLAGLFALRPAIGIALIALAVSPVPPVLPGKELKLGGHSDYVFGLFRASAVLAIVLAPLTVAVIGLVFSRHVSIAPLAIAKTLALTVLVPFPLGIIARAMIPAHAERASHIAGQVGMWLLILAFTPVLIKEWPAMMTLIGNGTLLALVAFTVVGLIVGHLLGGPNPDNRTVLALATASRHPGVAATLAAAVFPEQTLVAPALLLYLVVSAIASTPYVLWRRRRRMHAGMAPAA
jgi:bile acid:Na+ symporter, BASS family